MGDTKREEEEECEDDQRYQRLSPRGDDHSPDGIQHCAQLWVFAAATVFSLLWLPTVIKLTVSGHITCVGQICTASDWTANLSSYWKSHCLHVLQGFALFSCMFPWPARWCCAWTADPPHPLVKPHHVVRAKNIIHMGISFYPVYNSVKRTLTSCGTKHPSNFWNSSYFLNNLDLAVGASVAVIVWTAALRGLGPKRDGDIPDPRLSSSYLSESTELDNYNNLASPEGGCLARQLASNGWMRDVYPERDAWFRPCVFFSTTLLFAVCCFVLLQSWHITCDCPPPMNGTATTPPEECTAYSGVLPLGSAIGGAVAALAIYCLLMSPLCMHTVGRPLDHES